MATRPPTPRTAKPKPTVALAPVLEQSVGKYVSTAMRIYGVETNENRSIPALEDGMKPVHRRIIWAAMTTARNLSKTARLSGHVAGALHPHGTASIDDSITTLVNSPVPVLLGDGNWGDIISPAAAARYTNMKLSLYGESFLDRNYLPVTDMMPNYDDREEEPITLPSLLPNILMNDNMGIGLGVTTRIPAFTPTSLLKILLRLIDKEDVPLPDYVKTLQFFEPWGGRPAKSVRNRANIKQMMETGKGTVEWDSVLEYDKEKKLFLVNRFAPGVNLETAIAKINAIPLVDKVYSGKGLSYYIQVKKIANYNEVEAVGVKLQGLLRTRQSYSIYVAERVVTGDGKYNTAFHNLSVPDLLIKWLSYRVKLEAKSIAWRIGKSEAAITRFNLLIKACDFLDVIFKALRTSTPAENIAKGMKISVDEANVILELKVRQLSKLDHDTLKDKLKAELANLKKLQGMLKRPSRSVKAFFESCLELFEMHDKRHAGCDQWWLKPASKSELNAKSEDDEAVET